MMKTRTDIIIFSGQSNMEGQAEKPSDHGIVPNAYEYKYLTDRLVPLRDPVGEDILNDGTAGRQYSDEMGWTWNETLLVGSAAYGYASLVPSFCGKYTEMTGREVIAVSVAKGATKISDWLPGTPLFDILSKKLAGARHATADREIAGTYIVWLQGESDAIDSTGKEEYKRLLSEFGRALKDELGTDCFGVIRVGRFTDDERDLEIISAQDEICRGDPYFLMLTDEITELNALPEYMNPFAHGHLGMLGLQKVGRDAAATLAEFAGRD